MPCRFCQSQTHTLSNCIDGIDFGVRFVVNHTRVIQLLKQGKLYMFDNIDNVKSEIMFWLSDYLRQESHVRVQLIDYGSYGTLTGTKQEKVQTILARFQQIWEQTDPAANVPYMVITWNESFARFFRNMLFSRDPAWRVLYDRVDPVETQIRRQIQMSTPLTPVLTPLTPVPSPIQPTPIQRHGINPNVLVRGLFHTVTSAFRPVRLEQSFDQVQDGEVQDDEEVEGEVEEEVQEEAQGQEGLHDVAIIQSVLQERARDIELSETRRNRVEEHVQREEHAQPDTEWLQYLDELDYGIRPQPQGVQTIPVKKLQICVTTEITTNKDVCGICYTNETFIVTQCNHAFCSCITQNMMKYGRTDCPMCRTTITTLKMEDERCYKSLQSVSCLFPDCVEFV